MPQFAPDQVTFKDGPGYGAWDIGHAREHLQFTSALATKTPAVLIPDYDFLQFFTAGNAWKSVMQTHAMAHAQLRAALGLTGVDLSAFNLDDQDDFYSWLGYHRDEHALIRQSLGIT